MSFGDQRQANFEAENFYGDIEDPMNFEAENFYGDNLSFYNNLICFAGHQIEECKSGQICLFCSIKLDCINEDDICSARKTKKRNKHFS